MHRVLEIDADQVGSGGHRFRKALSLLARNKQHRAGRRLARGLTTCGYGLSSLKCPDIMEELGSRMSRLELCDRNLYHEHAAQFAQLPATGSKAKSKTAPASRRAKQDIRRRPATLSADRARAEAQHRRRRVSGRRTAADRARVVRTIRISRFTARAAVRVLSSAGLVTRRQRVGTVVIATARRRALQPRCGVVARSAAVRAGHRAAADLHRQGGARPRRRHASSAQRRAKNGFMQSGCATARRATGNGDRPFCLTRLYLNPVL